MIILKRKGGVLIERIIRSRIGKTPLLRAYSLEKHLGIKEIYFKLEGNNPSGHCEDRLAYLIIKDALSRGKNVICMGTYGVIGGSLSILAKAYDVKCVFYVPKGDIILRKKLFEQPYVEIIKYGQSYQECVEESRKVSQQNGWYNANPGLANSVMNMCAYSKIAEELNAQLQGKADTIFCQTSNGFAVSGLNLGFKQLWVNDKISTIPKINAITTTQGNSIYESFKKNLKVIEYLDKKMLKVSKINQYLINPMPNNGQEALNALYDHEGKAIGISDKELMDVFQEFKNIDRIKASSHHFFPIAGFIQEVKNGNISNGKHIIVLDDGRVNVDVRITNNENLPMGKDEFASILDKWLIHYSDPVIEIKEALTNALSMGYVLCAYQGNKLLGAAVVINTGFSEFATKYHLSYIATHIDSKGIGIATNLLNQAIELTKGNLSLHVDFENQRAIKLYQKLGFKKSYIRMIHQAKAH